jgi:hypothetical protein
VRLAVPVRATCETFPRDCALQVTVAARLTAHPTDGCPYLDAASDRWPHEESVYSHLEPTVWEQGAQSSFGPVLRTGVWARALKRPARLAEKQVAALH